MINGFQDLGDAAAVSSKTLDDESCGYKEHGAIRLGVPVEEGEEKVRREGIQPGKNNGSTSHDDCRRLYPDQQVRLLPKPREAAYSEGYRPQRSLQQWRQKDALSSQG